MNITLSLVIFVSAFGLVILGAIVGGYLEASGAMTRESIGPRGTAAVKACFFTLFCVLGFSAVPCVLRLFLFLQDQSGNAELFLVRFLRAHEQSVIYGIWGLFVIGLGVAVPAAVKGGFFR
jgi:hypothetical protein